MNSPARRTRQLPSQAVPCTNATRISQPFQPCRDVHAVAVNVTLFYDHIANVYSNSECKAPFWRIARGDMRYADLKLRCATHRSYRTLEFGKKAVSGALHDAATVLRDSWLDDLCHNSPKPAMRAFLVRVHQPRITGYVSGENSSETADHR
jgi:hypothetical protein